MREIPLSRGRVALVDDADYEWLMRWKWSFCPVRGGYAVRRGRISDGESNKQSFYLHRVIAGAPAGMSVDHINGDTLDNRRANLRIVTAHQSSLNRGKHRDGRSRYKGLMWHGRDGKWQAAIMVNGKRHSLGYFSHETDAARAYDAAARQYHGEYARLNFPSENA